MHEYDVTFKLVLQSVDLTIRALAGKRITRWLNVELPEVRNTRVDLLGETEIGDLVHIELQSSNDPKMPLRMVEYYLRVFRLFGKFPDQVLVYVGEPPLAMEAELNGPRLRYSYRLIDMRELDGAHLLESTDIGDNILAILTGLQDSHTAVHNVIERIAGLEPGEREEALRQLIILAGLRHLGAVVEEEARRMPILNNILDHEVLGREYRKGEVSGELNLLKRQIGKRFGTVPSWAEERLAKLSLSDIETIGLRVLDVMSLEELLA